MEASGEEKPRDEAAAIAAAGCAAVGPTEGLSVAEGALPASDASAQAADGTSWRTQWILRGPREPSTLSA